MALKKEEELQKKRKNFANCNDSSFLGISEKGCWKAFKARRNSESKSRVQRVESETKRLATPKVKGNDLAI